VREGSIGVSRDGSATGSRELFHDARRRPKSYAFTYHVLEGRHVADRKMIGVVTDSACAVVKRADRGKEIGRLGQLTAEPERSRHAAVGVDDRDATICAN
jgi:hypothetical protein